jgi:hypothetical protein
MSGRKSVIVPFKFIDGESLSAAFSSRPINIQYLDNIGITLACTAITANTGKFVIECTIDGETWIDIEVFPEIQLDDEPDNIIINLNNLPFSQMRVSFTPDGPSPDGVVTGFITAKEL